MLNTAYLVRHHHGDLRLRPARGGHRGRAAVRPLDPRLRRGPGRRQGHPRREHHQQRVDLDDDHGCDRAEGPLRHGRAAGDGAQARRRELGQGLSVRGICWIKPPFWDELIAQWVLVCFAADEAVILSAFLNVLQYYERTMRLGRILLFLTVTHA